MRQIYEFARKSNIIEGREVPLIKNVTKQRNLNSKKPGLNELEVKHLLETLVIRYKTINIFFFR